MRHSCAVVITINQVKLVKIASLSQAPNLYYPSWTLLWNRLLWIWKVEDLLILNYTFFPKFSQSKTLFGRLIDNCILFGPFWLVSMETFSRKMFKRHYGQMHLFYAQVGSFLMLHSHTHTLPICSYICMSVCVR